MSLHLRLLPATFVAASAVLLTGLTAPSAQAAPQSASLTVYGPVNENVKFAAAGLVTPIKAGRRVDLQVRSGSRWKNVTTATQDQFGGLNLYGKVSRTSKAKSSRGYEWRQFRLRARASGSLKEKVSASKKVKVLLDPKVYYRVLKSSVQHTADATIVSDGCGVVSGFSSTRTTDAGLGKAESSKPRWRAKRLSNGSVSAEIGPRLSTRWSEDLKGCRYVPTPAACETTVKGQPSGDGRQPLYVQVTVPKSGSKGSVAFATAPLHVGYAQAADSVCNVPMIAGGSVPAKIRTKSVSRSTLLGRRAFTVVNQGQAAWQTDVISGKPADLKLRWTESITLQRVDSRGKALR